MGTRPETWCGFVPFFPICNDVNVTGIEMYGFTSA